MKFKSKKVSMLLLSALLTLSATTLPASAKTGDNFNDVKNVLKSLIGDHLSIEFNNAFDVSEIKEIRVERNEKLNTYAKSEKRLKTGDQNVYYINTESGRNEINIQPIESGDILYVSTDKATVKIKFTQISLTECKYEAPILVSNNDSEQVDTEKKEDSEKEEKNDKIEIEQEITLKVHKDFGEFYLNIKPEEMINKIKSISVNHVKQEEKNSKYQVFSGGYHLDKDNGRIWFHNLKDDDLLEIEMDSGKVNAFKYYEKNSKDYGIKVETNKDVIEKKVLKARLLGFFEPAMVNQKKYDAISGATSVVSSNKNSNVVLQVALVENESDIPKKSDWKLLKDMNKIVLDKENSKIVLDPSSGMKGIYSTHDSAITLSGIPQKEGKYKVKVLLKDTSGRIASTNELPFNVYGYNEKLIDHLKEENAKATFDGKAMWDMEPWNITKFDSDKETVVVPSKIKAWFGSHTSGVYGELGYPIEQNEDTKQTLIIGKDTDLTMVNMKVKSSVKIIVKDGAKLNLRDSSIYGKIVVEKGGKFQMNYSSKEGKYLTGAQINGQLILEDGAELEKSMIYSNANFLTDGNKAKKVTDPVVLVKGNVIFSGDTFIKGDESATGKTADGTTLPGQAALKIENGSIDVKENATLGVYGGGRNGTTSHGGTAIILDKGSILGNGKLIAVAGSGTFGPGGSAVSGIGNIRINNAILQGGHSYSKKDDVGKAYEKGVEISNKTIGYARNGRNINILSDDDQPLFWSDIINPPTVNNIDYGKEFINPSGKDLSEKDKDKEKDKEKDKGKEVSTDNENCSRNKRKSIRKETTTQKSTKRIAGENRYKTAIEISKKIYKNSDTVVLANGYKESDSLAVVPYAKSLDAPILFTKANKLEKEVLKEIERLGVKKIVIIGGNKSINESLEKDLKKNFEVERISGKDRYETSVKIAEKLAKADKKVDKITLINGKSLVDSLSICNIANNDTNPILFVEKSSINDKAKNFIKKYNVEKSLIMGGSDSLEKAIENELKTENIETKRIAGKNRYETSILLAKQSLDNKKEIILVSGENYADALSAGPYVIKNKAVLVLANRQNAEEIKSYIKENQINKVTIIGGENSVPSKLIKEIELDEK